MVEVQHAPTDNAQRARVGPVATPAIDHRYALDGLSDGPVAAAIG